MPDHHYASVGIDKDGLLSLLEQASIAVEAVHDVISKLPAGFGPPSATAKAPANLRLRGQVQIARRFHDQYEPMFDPAQVLVSLSQLKTRGVVRILVNEGEFLVEGQHLIRTG